MTFLRLNSLLFFTYINIPHVHIGLNGQQSGTEEYHLPLGQTTEVGKSRGHTRPRLIEQRIDSAYQRIIAVV